MNPATAPQLQEQEGILAARYAEVRRTTEALAEPLAVEDYVVQSMPDVSPTKWHLAHVTWFFETFVLVPHLPGYEPVNPAYQYLFNSYYLGAGERHCRDQRGYISRPTVAEVYQYRRHVDGAMDQLLRADAGDPDEVARVVEIGLHHEQQHQELLLTDIKHVLSVNPLRPEYQARSGEGTARLRSTDASWTGPLSTHTSSTHRRPSVEAQPLEWVAFPEGLVEIGADGEGFTFDNERPRHRHFVEAFELASRPVTNREIMAFLADGGYERGELWLSEGWATAQERGWTEPFY
ncbi:MAG: ergothioneine biosynthesis protein EgtB, partial [Gemmatimonadetes bacterium]|nr:ergothioneine biosynthesis protein EgtB [Gemmatimonadota bacterium]